MPNCTIRGPPRLWALLQDVGAGQKATQSQDHRRVKRLTRPGLGFGGFWTARRTLAGFEAMAMIRKGQVQNIGGSDIRAQASFIAELFQIAA